MKYTRPTILLTNDDGIHAPGLRALWEALQQADFAALKIIAPTTERSGTGVGITWDRPILIQQVDWAADTPAWAIDGTPADCVKLGMRLILQEKPTLILSGINAGSNAGRNVLHSGTIGAVIEGALRGIPGAALSCEDFKTPNYHVAQKYIPSLVRYLLEHPLPSGTLLNVNFPHCMQESVKGFKFTRQGRGRWAEDPYFHIDTENGPSYWLGGKPEEVSEEMHSDIALLREGYMTAVPLSVQDLTDTALLTARSLAFEEYFCQLH